MKELKFGKPLLEKEEISRVTEVLNGDILVHGPQSREFENKFSEYVNSAHSLSVSSCTAALHLSYFCLGVKEGDEVIVPAQTHVATAHAVELSGAKPIFVDAELETGNIDIEQIEQKITEDTKAISVVHFLGMPVDMNKIINIAKKYDLKIIEDCALAVGAKLNNIHVGNFGDFGCFSFYPVKHFTTGEGGMIITNNSEYASKIKVQKAFGVDRTAGERKIPGVYEVNELGFNYRMSEIHAAIGVEQLKKVNGYIEKREENFHSLYKQLREIDEISLFNYDKDKFECSYYCLSTVLDSKISGKRFEIVEYLKEHGVGTSVYYPKPVPHFNYYRQKYRYDLKSFPNASKISYSSIALPVAPHLDLKDMDYISKIFKKAVMEVK